MTTAPTDSESTQTADAVGIRSSALFGGICWIGDTVTFDGDEVIVMDTDMLNGKAKVGKPDTSGIAWDAKWISWDFLGKPNDPSSATA